MHWSSPPPRIIREPSFSLYGHREPGLCRSERSHGLSWTAIDRTRCPWPAESKTRPVARKEGSGTTPRAARACSACATQAGRRSPSAHSVRECTFQPGASARDLWAIGEASAACVAHAEHARAARGVVPEPSGRATGRVLYSGGHGHRDLSIPDQDRPYGRSRVTVLGGHSIAC